MEKPLPKEMIEISPKMMVRLKEHSKAHPGGMRGKHMRNMVKFVKMGDSFTVAHNKAKKLDTPDKKSKPNTGNMKKKY